VKVRISFFLDGPKVDLQQKEKHNLAVISMLEGMLLLRKLQLSLQT
jgi:hypothetical protein